MFGISTDALGGAAPNPVFMAGVGRAVQRVSALKSARRVALARSEPPAAAAVPLHGPSEAPAQSIEMNSHVRIDTQSATPVSDAEPRPSLGHLLQAHRNITDLVSGALSGGVVDSLRDAANEMLYDIASVRATSWEEFGRKVQLLVDETVEGACDGWLTAVREGVYWDLKRLNGELAQAAA